jgi:ferredoxin-thioredoxin reductase catalytic subunit
VASKQKSIEDTQRFVRMVADKQGWTLVPDREFLEDLVQGLKTQYDRYGFYMCPCRDSWGDREHDEDIKCPCVYAPLDIAEYGHCYCGLFLAPEFAASGNEPTGIPERRPEELFP